MELLKMLFSVTFFLSIASGADSVGLPIDLISKSWISDKQQTLQWLLENRKVGLNSDALSRLGKLKMRFSDKYAIGEIDGLMFKKVVRVIGESGSNMVLAVSDEGDASKEELLVLIFDKNKLAYWACDLNNDFRERFKALDVNKVHPQISSDK